MRLLNNGLVSHVLEAGHPLSRCRQGQVWEGPVRGCRCYFHTVSPQAGGLQSSQGLLFNGTDPSHQSSVLVAWSSLRGPLLSITVGAGCQPVHT